MSRENILVIRLGALGDILLCLQSFQDIRRTFPRAHITLLTTQPFLGFAQTMPWFDSVIVDSRPHVWQLRRWLQLGAALKTGRFTRVFDLQNKPRTARYFHWFFDKRRTQWSGAAKGAAFSRPVSAQPIHRQEEARLQLQAANVPPSGALDLSWLQGAIDHLAPRGPYAILIPGCSPHLPHKRWPAERFAELTIRLQAEGKQVIAVGTRADATAIAQIIETAPFVRDLTGQTTLHQLASLCREAKLVVGNDTGPTFLAAMLGTRTLTLMSHHTDPTLSGPRGPRCTWLKRENIADISVHDALAAVATLN